MNNEINKSHEDILFRAYKKQMIGSFHAFKIDYPTLLNVIYKAMAEVAGLRDKEVALLTRVIASQKHIIQFKAEELAEKDKEIERVNHLAESTQSTVNCSFAGYESKISELKEEIESETKRVFELADDNLMLEAELSERRKDIERLGRVIRKMDADFIMAEKEFIATIDCNHKQIADLLYRDKNMIKEIDARDAEIAKCITRLDLKEGRITQLQKEIEQLKKELFKANEDYDKDFEKIKKLELEIEQLKAEVSSLQRHLPYK